MEEFEQLTNEIRNLKRKQEKVKKELIEEITNSMAKTAYEIQGHDTPLEMYQIILQGFVTQLKNVIEA